MTFTDYHKLLLKKTMLFLLLVFLVVLGFLMSEVLHSSDDNVQSLKPQRNTNFSLIFDPFEIGYAKGYRDGVNATIINMTINGDK